MLKKIKNKIASGLLALVPCGGANQPKCDMTQLFVLFKNLIGYAIYMGGLIVGVSILYGAFLMLTSAGDEGKVTQGRHAITSAVVGFAIILSAWLIVSTILAVSGCTGAWYVLNGAAFKCQ